MDKSRESEGLCLLATLKSLKYNELMDTPLPVGVVDVTGTGDPETVEAGLDPTADPNLDPSAEGWKTDPAEDTLDPADAILDIASDFAEIADPALDSNSDLAEVADGPLDPCWDPGGKADPNPDSADIADPALDPYCDPDIRSWLADPNLDIAGTLVADGPLDSPPLKKGLINFHFSDNMFSFFKMCFRMSFQTKCGSFLKSAFIFKMWKVSWVVFSFFWKTQL